MDSYYCPLGANTDERILISLHVEALATELDEYARRNANFVLGDPNMATTLMQSAVAVVARYLKLHRLPLTRGMTKTLLRTLFRRKLQRDATKSNHREFWGGYNDVEEATLAFVNTGQHCGYVDSVQVVRLLSQRSRAVLALRDLGYMWNEIAYFFQTSESVAKRMLRDDLRQALAIADHPEYRQSVAVVIKSERKEEARRESGRALANRKVISLPSPSVDSETV